MIFFLQLVNMVYYMDCFVNIEPSLQPQDKSPVYFKFHFNLECDESFGSLAYVFCTLNFDEEKLIIKLNYYSISY